MSMKDVLLWVKCSEPAFHATEKSFVKDSIDLANIIVVLCLEIATATPSFSNHHPDQSATIIMEIRLLHQQKGSDSLKAQKMVITFSKKFFFFLIWAHPLFF